MSPPYSVARGDYSEPRRQMRSAFRPACERPLQFVAMNYMPVAAAAGTLAAHFALTSSRSQFSGVAWPASSSSKTMRMSSCYWSTCFPATVTMSIPRLPSSRRVPVWHSGRAMTSSWLTADCRTAPGWRWATPLHRTKTLIVTGFAFQLPREELGRYDYLLKPVRPAELLRAIGRMPESCSPPSPANSIGFVSENYNFVLDNPD